MKNKYLNILLIALLLTSCNLGMIEPDVEKPSVKLQLSESAPSTEIIISWDKCHDADGYGIIRTFTRDGVTEESLYKYISADTTSYTDSACEPGTEYTYTVIAGYFKVKGLFFGRVFGDSLEESSEAKSITTKSQSLVCLKHPKNITITPDAEHTNALKLTWTPCKNASSYEVYQSLVENDYVKGYEKIQTVESAKCLVSHIYNESTYRFKIKALGADGQSSVFSAWKSSQVPAATNTTLDKAIPVVNGLTEKFYTSKDSLWFIITPQEGKLSIDSLYDLDAMIFSGDGSKHLKDLTDFTQENSWYTASFRDCINPGESYLLRLKTNNCIQFIVE